MVEHLWAGWRVAYMRADREAASAGVADSSGTVSGAVGGVGAGDGAGSLFEAILESGLPDEKTHILHRGERVFAIMNRYPYATGHLLVLPYRACEGLEALDAAERRELWETVHDGVVAVKAAFSPDGVNIGANLGEGAGPSVADHVHVHVLPRWRSDTNFMTAVADVRVLPQSLQQSWEQLLSAWPR
ncbi:MAG: HIT domain-containing protein [Acidimicrobiaceae bacterium]|nr:HIT domain-containing protein [Acidimicrobiaceae bacterium]